MKLRLAVWRVVLLRIIKLMALVHPVLSLVPHAPHRLPASHARLGISVMAVA